MRHSSDRPPQLSSGAHLSPDDGACVMELVSAAAGEAWTDAPRCTHALVAHVARLVNDASSDAGRGQLLPYVPTLVAVHDDGHVAHLRVVVACTSMAMQVRSSLLLAYLHGTALRQLAAGATCSRPYWCARLRRSLYRRGPAHRAVEAAVATAALLPATERDAWLRTLLAATISAASGEAGSGRLSA